MKFIRFGDIKAFDQERYKRCPSVAEYNHAPPRRKGFFAFPYAFCDQWYILHHHVREAHSPLKYLLDKNGRRLTGIDLVCTTETELLKELGLPKQPIIRDKRPTWVCIMRDPKCPPCYIGNGHLNQRFKYLKNVHGNRVEAEDFFIRKWSLEDFDKKRSYCNCKPCDLQYGLLVNGLGVYESYEDIVGQSLEANIKESVDYLSEHGINIESLFAWPCYEEYEGEYLAVYKKPKIFDYDGCVWHHLRKFVPPRSVLASYGTTWVYTSMRAFERALRHANPKVYARHEATQANPRPSLFGGPKCENSRYDLEGMYEAFFDEEDIKKIS